MSRRITPGDLRQNLTPCGLNQEGCFSLMARRRVVGQPGLVPLVKGTSLPCLPSPPPRSAGGSRSHGWLLLPGVAPAVPGGKNETHRHMPLAEPDAGPPGSPSQQMCTASHWLDRGPWLRRAARQAGIFLRYFPWADCCPEESPNKETGGCY